MVINVHILYVQYQRRKESGSVGCGGGSVREYSMGVEEKGFDYRFFLTRPNS
jgi:hypothetical protein